MGTRRAAHRARCVASQADESFNRDVTGAKPPLDPHWHAQFPFDVAELLASANGRRDVLAGLLHDSRDEDLPDLITQLSASVAEGNCDMVRRTAHALSRKVLP